MGTICSEAKSPPPPPNICERIVKAGTMHLALICSQELCLQAINNVSNPVLLHMTCRGIFGRALFRFNEIRPVRCQRIPRWRGMLNTYPNNRRANIREI
jgi:hypothetical protein